MQVGGQRRVHSYLFNRSWPEAGAIGSSCQDGQIDGWPELDLGERLTGGARSDVRLAHRGGEQFVVRSSRRSGEALRWELALMQELSDLGFSVPLPIPTTDGHLHRDGRWVTPFVAGRPPTTSGDWARVAQTLADLHGATVGHEQRLGFASSATLLVESRGGDVDLDLLTPDAVALIRRAWREVQVGPSSVVHGDPGVSNILVTDAGAVHLIDFDESRVDVQWFDLAALRDWDASDRPVRLDAAKAAAAAWEAATSWTAEPEYARRRLAELEAALSANSAGGTGSCVT